VGGEREREREREREHYNIAYYGLSPQHAALTHSNEHLSRTALIPHQLCVISLVCHGVIRGGLLCIPKHLRGRLGVEIGDIFELRRT